MQPFRIAPKLPAHAYTTYALSAPADVFVRAACEQVDCAAWKHGWQSAIDEATDLGKRQAHYIRTRSRRTFREQSTGGLTVFVFEPGQRCFAEHRTRPEVYTRLHGDWRGSVLDRQHTRPVDWVEDFAEHQQRIVDAVDRG